MRVLAAIGLLASFGALADPHDFRVHQLGNPGTSSEADTRFRIFARELAAALTSVNLMPPETLGHAAFAISAELSVVDLKTREFDFPTVSPLNGPLLIPSVHVRKGLPFSFELGARAGWLDKSRMAVGTLEGKWAVNEGFAFLPDIGVRGYVTRLFNNRDFDLTAAGLDLGVGKQFAVGGMITLTPYVGWNLVWVSATSNNVDFRPERSYEESVRSATAQLQDTNVFSEVRLGENQHNRYYGGLRFIGGAVQLGAEISYSSMGRFRDGAGNDRTMPAVITYNTMVGLDI